MQVQEVEPFFTVYLFFARVLCCTVLIGLGPGPYPFGSAGLDLLVLGLLRSLMVAVACCTLNVTLKQRNFESASTENEDDGSVGIFYGG